MPKSAYDPRTAAPASIEPGHLQLLRQALLGWYDANKRDLPWRVDRDPYRVWLSEIMLQQTRVAVVIDYYQRFLRRFPDVHTLARARESSVLAVWSGLGYYRRARYLHAAARIVSREQKGVFPSTSSEWADLPGIGTYTAAAIASIAFDEPCAVVDGNVERVLQRLSGNSNLLGKPLWQAAQQLLSPERPGDFNQAVMELGATVCFPDRPLCSSCPISQWCRARGPVGRRPAATRNSKSVSYRLSVRNRAVYLVKRPAGTLMPGMWELPALSSKGVSSKPLMRLRHSITDTDFTVAVLGGRCREMTGGQWIPFSRLDTLALTGLARKILKRSGVI